MTATGEHATVLVRLAAAEALQTSTILLNHGYRAILDAGHSPSDLVSTGVYAAWVADISEIRRFDPTIPGLAVLTRRSAPEWLPSQASLDCIWRPFEPSELVFRLQRLLRGARSTESGLFMCPVLAYGSIRLDVESRELLIGGARVELRRAEFEILRALMHRPRRYLTARELQARALGHDGNGNAGRNQVYELRRKLAAAGAPDVITFDRNKGYRLRPLEVRTDAAHRASEAG